MTENLYILISFILLILLVFRKILKKTTIVLNAQKEKIQKKMKEAEELRVQAEALYQKAQQEYESASKECHDIIQAGQKEAKRKEAQLRDIFKSTIQRRQKLAMLRIEQAEKDALSILKNKMIDISIEVSRQIIEKNMSPEQDDALINQHIDAIATDKDAMALIKKINQDKGTVF